MDWKYILSLDPNEINEDAKEELFNTITWFEVEDESTELDLSKCKALLRISQEVLKYKGEQVETLLHELEENAIRQGEEEAKRLESEADVRSVKSSRKSTSIEYENLEQKYIELKAKYKKALKVNEKQSSEIDKIRPSLEYCSHVWGCASKHSLKLLDSIKKRAVRLYDTPILTKDLHSLEHRRKVAGLSLFYRFYHGRCSSELSQIIIPRPAERRTLERLCVLTLTRSKSLLLQHFFFWRTSTRWN
nr:unnamed protein product [Callosobruchus analis]